MAVGPSWRHGRCTSEPFKTSLSAHFFRLGILGCPLFQSDNPSPNKLELFTQILILFQLLPYIDSKLQIRCRHQFNNRQFYNKIVIRMSSSFRVTNCRSSCSHGSRNLLRLFGMHRHSSSFRSSAFVTEFWPVFSCFFSPFLLSLMLLLLINAEYLEVRHCLNLSMMQSPPNKNLRWEALWLDDKRNSPWVKAEVVAMAPGSAQYVQLTHLDISRRLCMTYCAWF